MLIFLCSGRLNEHNGRRGKRGGGAQRLPYLDAGAAIYRPTDRCFCVAHKGPIRSRPSSSAKRRHERRAGASREAAAARIRPITSNENKSSMEPARSPQEPPVYVSPQSREEQQLVKELQNITGLEAHVAQRQLRYHEWELQPALAHYLDKGAVTAATSGAHRLLQRLHPNRDARPRAGEAVVRVTAATPSRMEPDLARAAAFARAALGDASLDIVRCVEIYQWSIASMAWGAGSLVSTQVSGASQPRACSSRRRASRPTARRSRWSCGATARLPPRRASGRPRYVVRAEIICGRCRVDGVEVE